MKLSNEQIKEYFINYNKRISSSDAENLLFMDENAFINAVKAILDRTKVVSIDEVETCESCEKVFPSDVMELAHPDDTALFCPQCKADGLIEMFKGFTKLFPSQYERYQNMIEEGMTEEEIEKAFQTVQYGDYIQLDDRFESVHIWTKEVEQKCNRVRYEGSLPWKPKKITWEVYEKEINLASKNNEEIKDIVLKEYANGNIVVSGEEGIQAMPIKEFVKQPVEGMLYDLNRNEAVVLTFIKDPKWINDYAVCKVIQVLKSQILPINYGYLFTVNGENKFVIAENISDAMDFLETKDSTTFTLQISKSIPILIPEKK